MGGRLDRLVPQLVRAPRGERVAPGGASGAEGELVRRARGPSPAACKGAARDVEFWKRRRGAELTPVDETAGRDHSSSDRTRLGQPGAEPSKIARTVSIVSASSG